MKHRRDVKHDLNFLWENLKQVWDEVNSGWRSVATDTENCPLSMPLGPELKLSARGGVCPSIRVGPAGEAFFSLTRKEVSSPDAFRKQCWN